MVAQIQKVNFAMLVTGLRSKGFTITTEDEEDLKKRATHHLNQFDNDAFFSNSFGGFFTKLAYGITSLLKNIGRNWSSFSLSNIGPWLSSCLAENTVENDYGMLDKATIFLYNDLREAGGNLAIAASAITGKAEPGDVLPNYSWSIYRQIRDTLPLTEEMKARGTSLDKTNQGRKHPPVPQTDQYPVADTTDHEPPLRTPRPTTTRELTSPSQ